MHSSYPARQPEDDRLSRILSRIAEGVAGTGGRSIFHRLVMHIAEALDVDYVLLSQIVPGEPVRVRALANYFLGEYQESFEYELGGTPCASVVNQEFRFYPQNVQQLFPDPHLVEWEAQSYAGIPLFDSDGNSLGLMAVLDRQPMRDRELVESLLRIFSVRAAVELERLKAHQASRVNEAQYQAIFNASTDGLLLWTLDGKLLDVNPSFAQMHGYSRDELVNASPAMFIPPESMGHLEDFTTAVSRGERFHAEMAALRKGGERFLADVQGVPIEYGGTPHMLAIVRDITRRKEQEQALLDNEDRLRATVESALDCIIAMDVDGNISEFNPAAEQVFGYLRADVLGRPLSELIIPPRFREAHLRGMERLKQYGDSRNRGKRIEVVAMRADGTEFPAELAIDVANGATGQIFIGYLRDITERKNAESERNRLESQLRQAQKMEAIGHLTGGVAHDFNNILTSVMGYIIMAQERAEELADDKQLRYLSRAQRAGQRARDLIQQMLTFSRGQRGEPRPIALSPLLKECIKLLEPAMPASIEYTCSFANRLPNVLIDPLHVEQILMNLCINARDAMDGHGVLTVTLQQHRCDDCVCASCQQSIGGDYVELTVQDTGHGIPPNVLERMFEPFFSTKDVGRGSGMGLATVHGIVHEYGGHILVDSVPGKYTCFRVLLPPLQQPSDTDSTDSDFADAQDRKAHLPQCTVLIVDDEQAVTEFMQDRLEQWGLSVVIINDPLEAMRYLAGADHGIDMIILDQTMPKMTGLELAARLQEHGTAPPIVLYTGYSQEVSEETLDGAGIHALLKKPVDQNELLGILRATLSPEPGSL